MTSNMIMTQLRVTILCDKPSKFDGLEISVLQFLGNLPDNRDGKLERDQDEKRWNNRVSSIVPRGLNLLDSDTTAFNITPDIRYDQNYMVSYYMHF